MGTLPIDLIISVGNGLSTPIGIQIKNYVFLSFSCGVIFYVLITTSQNRGWAGNLWSWVDVKLPIPKCQSCIMSVVMTIM